MASVTTKRKAGKKKGRPGQSFIDQLRQEAAAAPDVAFTRNASGYWIDGKFHRRVTTVTKGLPKEWMGPWTAGYVAQYVADNATIVAELIKKKKLKDLVNLLKGSPYSRRDEAADRGTILHDASEAITRGSELESLIETLQPDEIACITGVSRYHQSQVEAGFRNLACELTVFNSTIGYAGTLDRWDLGPERFKIIDWKTGKGVYDEYTIQMTGYRNAEFAIVGSREVSANKFVGKVIRWKPEYAEHMAVVHVTPEGARYHEIIYDERMWEVFKAANTVRQWMADTDHYGDKVPKLQIYKDPVDL